MDRLAEVYETFEDTWDVAVKESAEGDMLFPSEEDAVEKLEAARQHQDRTLEVPEDCRQSLDSAFREFSNCRALHEAVVRCEGIGTETLRTKRKAEEAHTRTFLQRESFRRETSDCVKAEEVLTNGVGCRGTPCKDTAGAHDRESNETKYLREATDMIEEWQGLLQRGASVDHPSCGHSVVFN